MADFFGAAGDLVSGIGSFMGSNAAAKGAKDAAKSYANAARLSMASTSIKQAMVDRDVYKTIGGMSAAASGNGLHVSGSVTDLIRDSARQGAIAKAIVGLQGDIDYNSWNAQSQAAAAQAKAAKSGGTMGLIGSAVGIIGSLFSDDSLKQDVELVRTRGDGIGVYRFRYIGSEQFFEGAMAQDVYKHRPDAVYMDDDVGLMIVDYDAIKMDFRSVD